ncbi:MAG: S-methyl-5'-thioadenosine phosphorylase [Firmicutes bacterium]|nr:S-methyl-5'-thioadenosine phosphorylase [Bacillota bacterium]
MKKKADVGVFGGSGFYSFLTDVEEVTIDTPFGSPSDSFKLARLGDKTVAFLPRHGSKHTLPPHKINYRANLWAMHSLGVRHIIAPAAVGSLQADIKPGEFVICDQFVNRTWGRADTFYEGPEVRHVSAADPYCPRLRSLITDAASDLGVKVHPAGTMVVINGPRFSTRAESREYSRHGWHVIGMTGYPEAILARELEICYANISLVTDFDAGLEGRPDIAAVTHQAVLEVFAQNIENVKRLLFSVIESLSLDAERNCVCATALAATGE